MTAYNAYRVIMSERDRVIYSTYSADEAGLDRAADELADLIAAERSMLRAMAADPAPTFDEVADRAAMLWNLIQNGNQEDLHEPLARRISEDLFRLLQEYYAS